MSETTQFEEKIQKQIAASIPCIHMNTMLISNRVLKTFKGYLLSLKEEGASTIDDVINIMEKSDGK